MVPGWDVVDALSVSARSHLPGQWLLMAHICPLLRIVLGCTGTASPGKLGPLLPRSSLLLVTGDRREQSDISLATKWDHLYSGLHSPELPVALGCNRSPAELTILLCFAPLYPILLTSCPSLERISSINQFHTNSYFRIWFWETWVKTKSYMIWSLPTLLMEFLPAFPLTYLIPAVLGVLLLFDMTYICHFQGMCLYYSLHLKLCSFNTN